jgi:hypothetical protein
MLWDEEFKPLRDTFDRIPGNRRFTLAVTAIDRTLSELDPPIGDSRGAELLKETLTIARTAAANNNHAGLPLPEGTSDEFSTILANGTESAVGPLIMAVIGCFGLPDEGMPAQTLYAVFSHCYEAVFEHEEEHTGDLETVEDERANPRCTATIAWQKGLLAEVS